MKILDEKFVEEQLAEWAKEDYPLTLSQELKAKDTFYMNGKTSHYLYNHGNTEALVLWVTNPPMF